MPAKRWGSSIVYVLVPTENVTEREMMRTAQLGCRVALMRGFTPICPSLFYGAFATPEEHALILPRLSMQWYRRAAKIWLCFASTDERLDRTAYRMLEDNERATERRPVYTIERYNDEIVPVPLTRIEVREILDCSLSTGLAHCCA